MQKWQKVLVVFGVVISLTLLVRRATAQDIEYRQLKVKDLTNSLPKARWTRYAQRDLSQIDTLVLHHSATRSGTPQAYARYHVEERGWPGIGYHYVIQKDGTIYQTNRLDTISYHVTGQNTNSIGICLTGNFDEEAPAPLQLQRCAELMVALRQNFPQELKIRSHSAYSTKTCPGKNINMENIVSLVRAYEQAQQV